MKKALIAGAAILLVLVIGGLLWWHHRSAQDQDHMVLNGNVDIRQISLAFDGNGRVLQLRADEGDQVKAGQVLGLLDTRTLALQAAQAQAQIDVQQQNLLRLQHGSRPQELAQARSRLAAAEASATKAAQDLARLQDIAAKSQGHGVSPQDLDSARSNAQVTRAQANEQQQALRLTELGPREEEVAGAEAQLKASQAQLAVYTHQINEGELVAPADAIVRSRLLEPGDMATPQRPVFTLALAQPKWVRVYVSETQLALVRSGMAASVTTDTHPNQPVQGTIGFISSTAEFTPKNVQTEELRTSLVYEVRVLVRDPNNALRLGQPATVRIDVSAERHDG